jgi:COP9 signalosome complex subunit 1
LLIEQKNYAHIPTYVFKAEAALDAASASAANANNGASASAPIQTTSKKATDRDRVQSKLDFATALAYLGQGNYEKAAGAFLNLGPPTQLGDWAGKVFLLP